MRAWAPASWRGYAPCHKCAAPAGEPCVLTAARSGLRRGDQKLRPHPGRRQGHRGRPRDPSLTDDRLTVWKREARQGTTVEVIAHQLGMKRAALDRFVVRARERGHPDAVYHALAEPYAHRLRARRRQRQQGQQHHQA